MAPELTEEEKQLVEAAQKIRKRAWARYSGMQVGAAVLTGGGKIYPGVNVESGSYGLTVCAERVAVFNAVTAGDKDLVAVAVASPDERIWYPCGACRQVLAEFGTELRVVLPGDPPDDQPLSAYLPHSFGPGDLQGSSDG